MRAPSYISLPDYMVSEEASKIIPRRWHSLEGDLTESHAQGLQTSPLSQRGVTLRRPRDGDPAPLGSLTLPGVKNQF